MNNIETNTLELKLYDNLGLKENSDKFFQRKNFMEFYVDGKSLINEIGKVFWNKNNSESFFDQHIGFLGSFDEETDLKFISLMLNFDSKKTTRKFIKDYSSFEISEEKFEHLFKEIKEENKKITLLYGCPCGDIYCGGIGVEIKNDKKYHYWIFGENENSLVYKFDSIEYQNEMIDYLEWKKWC